MGARSLCPSRKQALLPYASERTERFVEVGETAYKVSDGQAYVRLFCRKWCIIGVMELWFTFCALRSRQVARRISARVALQGGSS